jgi:hypothetical protein
MENRGAGTISINDADFFGTPERPKEVMRALKGRGIQWQATNENLRTSPAVSVIRTKNLQRQGVGWRRGRIRTPRATRAHGGRCVLALHCRPPEVQNSETPFTARPSHGNPAHKYVYSRRRSPPNDILNLAIPSVRSSLIPPKS